jgi:hypothetical protein
VTMSGLAPYSFYTFKPATVVSLNLTLPKKSEKQTHEHKMNTGTSLALD